MNTTPSDHTPFGDPPLDELIPLLDAELDGSAGPDALRRLEELCALFPECARERGLAHAMRSSCDTLRATAAPPWIARSVFREVRNRRWRRFVRFWKARGHALLVPPWRPALALGLLAFVSFSIFAVLNGAAREEQTETYTDAEIEVAVEEVKWALGVVGKVGRKTGVLIRDEVFEPHVVVPINRSLHAALNEPFPIQSSK